MKAGAIVRIVLFAILTVCLIAALVIGLTAHGFLSRIQSSGGNPVDYRQSGGQVDAADVTELQIQWVSGSITLIPGDTDQIHFEETGIIPDGNEMVWKLSGSTLILQYRANDWAGWFRSFGFTGSSVSKELTVTVPRDWICQELRVEAVSADISVTGLRPGDVTVSNVSGDNNFLDCDCREFNLNTTSGDVRFSGSLEELDVESVSASCTAVLTAAPRQISMDCVSGRLELTLPEDCGFTADLDSVSGRVSSDFGTTSSGDTHIYGDGACRIEVDSVSGDILIHKGSAGKAA